MKVVEPRSYRMTARAQSAAATGERILDAAAQEFWARPTDQISLQGVAQRAGVSTQTLIRRFGGKDGLLAAASARELERVRRQRFAAPVGDTRAAVKVLIQHYEVTGERVLKMLAEEQRLPGLVQIANTGRALHKDWCATVFAPALAGRGRTEHRRRLAQIVAVCDVYMWKLLRRDAALSRDETELALVELLNPILERD